MRAKNILVAGGTGLVGTNLTKKLVDLGARVLASYFSRQPQLHSDHYRQFDFTRFEDCVEATRDMDYTFICAAQTYGAKIMKESPTALILPNLRINSGLLEACRLNNVKKVLFISSSTVYQEAFYPIREDELDLNQPPYDLYLGVGWMKRYIEQLINFYRVRYGLKIAIVRPTNIYGSYDKFDGDTAHALPALIKRAMDQEDPYIVWGNGYTVRDFIYVEDFADTLIDIARTYDGAFPLNISTGSSITIREAVNVILDVCGHRVTPQYDETKPDAIPYRMLDTTRFEAILGHKPWTPFEIGIRKTVKWYNSLHA